MWEELEQRWGKGLAFPLSRMNLGCIHGAQRVGMLEVGGIHKQVSICLQAAWGGEIRGTFHSLKAYGFHGGLES